MKRVTYIAPIGLDFIGDVYLCLRSGERVEAALLWELPNNAYVFSYNSPKEIRTEDIVAVIERLPLAVPPKPPPPNPFLTHPAASLTEEDLEKLRAPAPVVEHQVVEVEEKEEKEETDPVFNQWLVSVPNVSLFTNDAHYITETPAEVDPVFQAWVATTPPVSIFTNDAGYLTEETDPVFRKWLKKRPSVSEFINDVGYAIGGVETEVDPIFTASPAYTITNADIANWNAGGPEVDPVFTAWLAGPPPVSTFTNDVPYLTTWGPETDPVFNLWLSGPPNISIFTNNSGYLTSVTPHPLLNLTHSDTTPALVTRGDLITGQGLVPSWNRLAVGAATTYLAGGVEPSWATLNQAAISGLTTASSPTFAGLTLSGLSPNAVVYTGLGGLLTADATNFGYDGTTFTLKRLAVIDNTVLAEGQIAGVSSNLNVAPTVPTLDPYSYTAAYFRASLANDNLLNNNVLYGMSTAASTSFGTTVPLDRLIGSFHWASAYGSGTVTDVRAGSFSIGSYVDATITNGYGVYVQAPDQGTSGRVLNSHGVYIENQGMSRSTVSYGLRLLAQSGSTTNWAIYSAGGQSSHLGNFRIGSNVAPTVALDVTGSTQISTLTAGRATYAGTAGLLKDNAVYLFDETTLTAPNFATGAGTVGAEKITNGSFASDATSWTGGGGAFSGSTPAGGWAYAYVFLGVPSSPTLPTFTTGWREPTTGNTFTQRFGYITSAPGAPTTTGAYVASEASGEPPVSGIIVKRGTLSATVTSAFVTIANGGSGYTPGTVVLTVNQTGSSGTGKYNATADAGGTIVSINSRNTAGSNYSYDATPLTTTAAAGAGCTLNLLDVVGTGPAYVTYSSFVRQMAACSSTANGTLSQAIASMVSAPVVGERYSVSYTLSYINNIGTSLTPSFAGVTLPTVTNALANTKHTHTIIAANTTGALTFTKLAAARYVIDDISIKKVDGSYYGSGNLVVNGSWAGVQGVDGTGPDAPVDGSGTRMMFVGNRAAFRVGQEGTFGYWSHGNLGYASFSSGSGNRAKGNFSAVFGNGNIGDAFGCLLAGSSNYASDNGGGLNFSAAQALLVGISNEAGDGYTSGSGNACIGLGEGNHLYGAYQVGIGLGNTMPVGADYSVSIGSATISALGCANLGATNALNDNYQVTIGNVITLDSTSEYAISLGYGNTHVNAPSSLSMGTYLASNGYGSICIGYNADGLSTGSSGAMEAASYGAIVMGYNIAGGTFKATNEFSFAGGGTIYTGSTVLSAGAGSFVYGFAGDADTATAGTLQATGTLGVAIGWNLESLADYCFCYGYGFTESTANSFNLGWGQLDYQFSSTTVTLYRTLKTDGGVVGKITTVTNTYDILATDETVICDKVTAFTVTLPVGVVGQKFTIKNIGAGTVTLEGNGADTIDGDANQSVLTWDSIQVQCYAANAWGIM